MSAPLGETLGSFLQFADDAHEQLIHMGVSLSAAQLDARTAELKEKIRQIQAVAIRLRDVSNIWAMFANFRFRNCEHSEVQTYPRADGHAELRVPAESDFAVQTVSTAAEIPVARLYFVADEQTHAINVNGLVVRGNLATIDNDKLDQTAACKFGSSCNNIPNCTYYHAGCDFIACGLPVPAGNTRNFTVGSWIHTQRRQVKHARRVGNGDTLEADMAKYSRGELATETATREGQLMHDVLVYLTLMARSWRGKKMGKKDEPHTLTSAS